MLPVKFRLRAHSEIMTTLKRGKRITTPYVHIYVYARPQQPHSRVACVVGKRVHKSAVRRHRYQRLLREVARPYVVGETALTTSCDMVWVGQPKLSAAASAQEIRESLPTTLL